MIQEIIVHRPGLAGLARADSVQDYLMPAFDWNPVAFPYRSILSSILFEELSRLYRLNGVDKDLLREQLRVSWAVQTGEHISIPRVRECVNQKKHKNGLLLPSHNPMVFQGVVYWAAMSLDYGFSFSIEMATGRVPPNNPLSGSYLEISPNMDLVRLVAEKWHQTPQILIPAVGNEALLSIEKFLNSNKHLLSLDVFTFWGEVIDCFAETRSSFVDQVASAHSLIMSRVMPIQQLTVESERIAVDFLIKLLQDEHSLINEIFSHGDLLDYFLKKFSNIATGWDFGETPFYQVTQSGKGFRLKDYDGDLTPATLKCLLEQGVIYPKGVMKFFCFMVEGGLLSVGGMCQNVYCSEIRARAVEFLEYCGDNIRTQALRLMPTGLAVITPCWGLKNGGERLVDVLDYLDSPIKNQDMKSFLQLRGLDSLNNAALVLYPFLTGKPVYR